MKKLFSNQFKKAVIFEVVGGQNLLPKSSGNIYSMMSEEKEYEEGVVTIKKQMFYFLGAYKEEKSKRSAGGAATGAIVGGVLTGGAGAIIGAAIGGRQKDDSLFWIDFMDFKTKQEFSVQVKQRKGGRNSISDFRPYNPGSV